MFPSLAGDSPTSWSDPVSVPRTGLVLLEPASSIAVIYDPNREPDKTTPSLARRGAMRIWIVLSVAVLFAALAWIGPTTPKGERLPAALETSEPR